MTAGPLPSKSRVDKAGEFLRRLSLEPLELNGQAMQEELDVLDAWRAQFRAPLQTTVMGLRSAINTCLAGEGVVRQRLKREEQIIAKLARSSTRSTRLSQMEDIAGCRAIVPGGVDRVYRVQDQLATRSTRLEIRKVDDYIERPRSGGYRALHIHGIRDGVAVEIQLRTADQHEWAQTVEDWDEATGHDVKHERAPEGVVEFFAAMAAMIEDREMGGETPEYTRLRAETASRGMLELLRGRGGDDGDV